ncbi:NACHT domain-containing protein [Streptomyces albidocamelliae]|uniref:NACHT domain-containing protein n=1 Tax=Streptomyces albidocamelliae TaxID=2981135 RepID=A0ABY6F213_9ACTN|nr:NACHT domain-containing protein [Streptomyces sp. HUAS 14-6]UXY40511.1 NACHT domain-containing protein [Streptomyces sp. HUAS 14-6]
MERSRRNRRAATTYLLLQVLAATVALWLAKHFQVARLSATLVALAPTMPAAYLAWAAYREDREEAAADLEAKATMLANSVAAAETLQRAQLLGPGAHRIDLAFNLRAEPANNATGGAPYGRFTDIVSYYKSLRPARLVITGEPGAGKTLLALDLLLGLLSHPNRTPADPIPIRLSLAGWESDRPLTEWLTEKVHQHYRDRGVTAADAAVLVEQRRILPVLDGLDEMDTDDTPAARRRAARALQQLNTYQDPTGSAPVILTCRTAQYEQLTALDVRMREAARIEITAVTPTQADAYLTARSVRPDRWRLVLDTLATVPGGTLARALDTPWRLNLAVTAYEERHPETLAYLRDPADLIAMASPSAVRDHLLALYLSAASSQHPTHPRGYRPDRTHRWLAALAAHLATTPAATGSGTDLVLHRLWPMAGPRRVRTADALIAAFAAAVFYALWLTQVPIGLSTSQLAGGTLGALVAVGLVWHASRPVGDPETLQVHLLRTPAGRRQIAPAIALQFLGGLMVGVVFGLLVGLVDGLRAGLVVGSVIGLGSGLTVGFLQGLTAPLRDAPPTDPRYPLRDTLIVALVTASVTGLGSWLAFGFMMGPALGVLNGVGAGLVSGFYLGTEDVGRRYLVFLCCSRRQLPWRLGPFLNWAYGAGLLRISGVAYQFRHRELQDWLAAHPNP